MLATGERTVGLPSAATAAGRALAARGHLLLLLATCTHLGASALAGGGADDGSLPWGGGGALAVCAVVCGLALAGRAPWPNPSRAALATVGLFALLVAWTGGSVAWSYSPGLSWEGFNRSIVHLALLLVGLLAAGILPRAQRAVAIGLAATVATAAAWALAGKIAPGLFEDGARAARLREPVGYWNALALLLAYGIPLALWLAVQATHRRSVRVAGAALLFLLVPAIVLTISRGGLLAALVVVLGWVVLVPRRVESLAVLLLAGLPGAAAAAWALRQPGIVGQDQPFDVRSAAGQRLGVLLAVGLVVVAALALGALRLERRGELSPRARRRLARGGLGGIAAIGVIVAIALVASGRDPLGFLADRAGQVEDQGVVTNDPSRLLDPSANLRFAWWEEAGRVFLDHPVVGSGANTFQVLHRLERDNAVIVLQPHNLPLQFLADLGLVGGLLAGGALVAGLFAAWQVTRRISPEDRLPAVALLLAAVAYPVHGFLDFDWDVLAVTGPMLLGLGVLLGWGAPALRSTPRPALAIVPAALLAVLTISLVLPALSDRAIGRAYAAMNRTYEAEDVFGAAGAAGDAVRLAERAVRLNPLSIDARWTLAQAHLNAGRPELARLAFRDAVALEPKNPQTYREWGLFETEEGNNASAAMQIGLTALALDPHDIWIESLNIRARCKLGLPIPPQFNWNCATQSAARPIE